MDGVVLKWLISCTTRATVMSSFVDNVPWIIRMSSSAHLIGMARLIGRYFKHWNTTHVDCMTFWGVRIICGRGAMSSLASSIGRAPSIGINSLIWRYSVYHSAIRTCLVVGGKWLVRLTCFLCSFFIRVQIARPVSSSKLKIVIILILPTSLTFVIAVVSSRWGLEIPGRIIIGASIRRIVVTQRIILRLRGVNAVIVLLSPIHSTNPVVKVLQGGYSQGCIIFKIFGKQKFWTQKLRLVQKFIKTVLESFVKTMILS